MSNALKQHAANVRKGKVASPQMERTPGRTDEVLNNAGGYVFVAEDKLRLERFLILGTDGGTYYVGQRDLTNQNVDFVRGLISRNPELVINTLVDVADNNRAAKNSPSLYVLALLFADENVNKAALRGEVFNKVVRTSTHLFEFANYLDSLGGWGRAKRNAIAEWYTGKDANALAYQAVKYRQREGWTHRDLFRKVHPVGVDAQVGNFILGKDAEGVAIVDAFKRAQAAKTVKDVVAVLEENKNLPWEAIPTQFLNEPAVWKTLFYNGAIGQTALLRNVTRFAKIGLFDDLVFAGDVAARLEDKDAIIKGRLHPVAYANALGVYRGGTNDDWYYSRRTANWNQNPKIAGALERGFYNAFAAVEPAGKRTMVSLDVSGSMTWGAPAGLVGLNYMEAAAIMAMVTIRTEPYAVVNAFASTLQQVNISDSDSFETVMEKLSRLSFGGTDISAPLRYAKNKGMDIDTFVVYSDMETWAGEQKVFQALNSYRSASGRNARFVAVGLASTSTKVTDPEDTGSLNLVGFDSSAPKVLADFSAGRV